MAAQAQNGATSEIRTVFQGIDAGSRQVADYAEKFSKSSHTMGHETQVLKGLVDQLSDKKAA